MGWLLVDLGLRLKIGSFCSPLRRSSHWAFMKRRKRCWTVVAHFLPCGWGARMMALNRVRSFQPIGEFWAVKVAMGSNGDGIFGYAVGTDEEASLEEGEWIVWKAIGKAFKVE